MALLESQICAACGIEFGVPAAYVKQLRESGKAFYCPSGHNLTFGAGEMDKLRKENQRLVQQHAYKDDRIKSLQNWAEREQKTARAYKGQTTRLKNRAKAGMCPCCRRTFQNLHDHMTTQHPKFDPHEPVKEEAV